MCSSLSTWIMALFLFVVSAKVLLEGASLCFLGALFIEYNYKNAKKKHQLIHRVFFFFFLFLPGIWW